MTAQRMFFLSMAAIIGAGIWLTGYDKVNWFLYFPVAAMLFAGITGICPGLIFWRKMGFRDK